MATTDFVMPKLGLTMTEGTVARWDVSPGGRFKSGDIIVVVETDKIAYDVEAPASGVLEEVLVAAGNVVPVGAPIGRWDIGDSTASFAAADVDAPVQPAATGPGTATALPPANPVPPTRAQGQGARILATPFARRLARHGGIELRGINGTGPRGRIKAADVERAIAISRSVKPLAPAEAAPAAFHSAGVQMDVSALLALNDEVKRHLPDLRADLMHYVVLAAAKASDVFHEPPVIALAANRDGEPGAIRVFAAAECHSLRGVIARIADVAASSDAAVLGGTLWIECALDGISFLSAAPPSGWQAALAIGSVRDAFRPDAEGRPVPAALVDVVLTCSANALDAGPAQRLLLRIRDLLEAPLLLLAS
jgi:pyruvate dehydrogenase E2 component (dihydrolipoamide acetyltransferase)